MAELVPLGAPEFRKYLHRLIAEYAKDHVKDGSWTREESLSKSKREVETLLPEGLKTSGHFLFSIITGPSHQSVGMVWLAILPSHGKGTGFIYDLYIERSQRRKGYAYEAMRALEHFSRKRGLKSLKLHVFAHNPNAIALYQKLGYAPTNLIMAKNLAP